ncbi:hypothetical protein SELMODRAFT_413629 [Selaginella moellendorffii]|uniref:Uncharacterized protein n=1 Tax=Selaginella moellendorffii TaxID=88036 RepID=D8RQW4_SELML|nr:hypothetical protein SELMODRAFT_413629 [Selaginella moellendorffii]
MHLCSTNEAVDIFKDHYQEGIGSQCLKLSMTDDAQRVFGIEYRPTPQLKELDEARQRVVHQVNKPPRGNRHPRGTTPPSLEEQLTQAAWPRTPDVQENNGPAANPGRRQAPVSIEDFSRGSYSYSEQTPSKHKDSIGPRLAHLRRLLSAWEIRVFICFPSNPIKKPGLEDNFARWFLESGVVQSGRVKDHDAYQLAIYIEDGSLLMEALVNHEHRVVAVNDYPEMDGGFLPELKLFKFAARIISDPFHCIEFDCSHQENRKENS